MAGYLNLSKYRPLESGQTSVEYLLLMAMTFITAYILVRGPVANFTKGIFTTLQVGLQNMVTNAEWTPNATTFNQTGDPSSQARLKALHL
jgi:hypothetical protein